MGDWASGLSCGLFGVVHVLSVLSCVRSPVTEGSPETCVSGSRDPRRLDAWTEPREARFHFQVSACGGVSGFEAEDGQAATGLGRAGSRRLPVFIRILRI